MWDNSGQVSVISGGGGGGLRKFLRRGERAGEKTLYCNINVFEDAWLS